MIQGAYTEAKPARHKQPFPIWIPVFPVWLLLMLFVILFTPLVFVGFLLAWVNPFRGVAAYWQLCIALRGVRIEVNDPGAPISIRMF